jgi:hypothetical protein
MSGMVRELTVDEIDAVSGGRVELSANFLGIRIVAGTNDDGGAYYCVNTATHGSCTTENP